MKEIQTLNISQKNTDRKSSIFRRTAVRRKPNGRNRVSGDIYNMDKNSASDNEEGTEQDEIEEIDF